MPVLRWKGSLGSMNGDVKRRAALGGLSRLASVEPLPLCGWALLPHEFSQEPPTDVAISDA